MDKKCQQQDDMIKQLREELVFKQVNLLTIIGYLRVCTRCMHIAFLVQGIFTVIISCEQKLLADNYSAIFSVDDQVDVQLKEKLSAMQASLETSKAETASALASLEASICGGQYVKIMQ